MRAMIRYPSINGKTTQEQLTEIKSYLYQLVDQLNYEVLPQSEPSTENSNNQKREE